MGSFVFGVTIVTAPVGILKGIYIVSTAAKIAASIRILIAITSIGTMKIATAVGIDISIASVSTSIISTSIGVDISFTSVLTLEGAAFFIVSK